MPRRNPRMAVNRRRGVVQPPVCSIDQDRGRDQGTDEVAEDRCWGQVEGQQERGEARWGVWRAAVGVAATLRSATRDTPLPLPRTRQQERQSGQTPRIS
jgi:hypothetical protein